LTVKFHSLYVKESGVGNFGKVGVGIGNFTSDSATLVKGARNSVPSPQRGFCELSPQTKLQPPKLKY